MIKDLSNQRFGRLTALKVGPPIFRGRTLKRLSTWVCLCDCGREVTIPTQSLINHSNTTCGSKECRAKAPTLATLHPRLYKIWEGMKYRCSNKRNLKYGGRGITHCLDWTKFEPFALWALSHGYDDELTLERIDVNGNYEPSNCTWVTWQDQQNNKRNSKFLELWGERKTVAQWMRDPRRKVGSRRVFQQRLDEGWEVEKAFCTPPQMISRKS